MANKYLITGGGNWSGSSWNTASNQATSNTTAPTTSDVAILDQYSGQCTIDTTTCVCSSLSASLYANTITFTSGQKLTCSSGVTIGSGATIAGSGNLTLNGGAITISPTFTGSFTAATTTGKTLGANLTVQGLITWSATCTFTGAYNVYAQGGYSGGTGSSGLYWSSSSGCPNLYLQGGTIYGTMGGNSGNIYFDGNITFTTGTSYQQDIRTNGTVEYLSGTVTSSNSILRFIAATPTLKLGSGCPLYCIHFTTGTYTLTDDLYLTYFQTITGSPTINGAGYKVFVSADVICYGVGTYSGTVGAIEMTGTGTFGSNTTIGGITLDNTFTVNCNIIINTAGTVTFKNKTIYYGGIKTMTYTAGTVVTTGAIFSVYNGNYFFDINSGFTIPTLRIDSINYCGIKSDLTINNIILIEGSTFAIYNTVTLTVTTSMTMNGAKASIITFYEPSGSGLAYLNYQGTIANCEIFETEISRIDASGSAVPIYTWYGYKSATCVNVYAVTGSNIKQQVAYFAS